ncbi:histidine acid phosphatase [Paraphaeosphaeria minitans]|uniref:Histidine acid phosphatase n=1 Tax=Paraphaeosphaeria minitans TaxID=565426 RepID=A0A9P6KJ41_9PLEO|nr:histidine acid phosphatase [Paraphaeosphaeria minitans]
MRSETETLVPVGKQQLFDSGTLHYYQYRHLYSNNGSKVISRTIKQRRMLESVKYFMAGDVSNCSLGNRVPTGSAQALCAYQIVVRAFSPVGRAIGKSYVNEALARMQHHVLYSPTALINTTLYNNTVTVCTQQALSLDFSHDSKTSSIVAFDLTQFAEYLSPTRTLPGREFVMAYIQPFARCLDIEVIQNLLQQISIVL